MEINNRTSRFKRGQIWFINISITDKEERDSGITDGARPYLILTNDDISKNVDFLTVCACSTSYNRISDFRNITYYSSANSCKACVLFNQIRTIPCSILRQHGRYLETVSDDTMKEVTDQLMEVFGIINSTTPNNINEKLIINKEEKELIEEVPREKPAFDARRNTVEKKSLYPTHKPKGFWTLEMKSNYIDDCNKFDIDDVVLKYNIASRKSAQTILCTFKKELSQK